MKALENHIAVSMKALELTPPFQVTVGLIGVKNALLSAPGGPFNNGQFLGPIFEDEIVCAGVLTTPEAVAQHAFLRTFFMNMWDAANAKRADVLDDGLVQGHQLPPR